MKKTFLLLLMLSFFVFSGFAPNPGEDLSVMNVKGIGKVTVSPDTVDINIEVSTEGKDSSIQKINAQKTEKVTKSLINLGLSSQDIKTVDFRYYPISTWDKEKEEQKITGYKSVNILKVSTNKLELVGKIIDTAINTGSERVDSLNFTLSEEISKKFINKAILNAVEDAQQQALAAAKAINMNIAGIKEIDVNTQNNNYRPVFLRDEIALKSNTPINPEDVEIMASVDLTYIIK